MLPFFRRSRVKTIQPFGRGLASDVLRLILCDTSVAMTDAWIDTFRDLAAIEIVQGDLLELRCDALVSPANSFGDMSGGIDKCIDDHFQGEAQRAAVEAIRTEFLGELPVGVALIVTLPRPRSPFLVVTPTMRVPGNVADTVNAYLAMRAVLVAVTRHNARSERKITRLAVPGLCTGVGGMSPGLAAIQMRAAYDAIVGGAWQEVAHPAMAPFALGSSSGRRWTFR